MPHPLSFSEAISGIFGNKCPHCLRGKVFSGIYAMNPRCPDCGIKFEKESGYFLGAIVFSYFIGVFSVIPILISSIFLFHLEISTGVMIATVQILAMHPLLNRYSKLVWLYVENRMTNHLDA